MVGSGVNVRELHKRRDTPKYCKRCLSLYNERKIIKHQGAFGWSYLCGPCYRKLDPDNIAKEDTRVNQGTLDRYD